MVWSSASSCPAAESKTFPSSTRFIAGLSGVLIVSQRLDLPLATGGPFVCDDVFVPELARVIENEASLYAFNVIVELNPFLHFRKKVSEESLRSTSGCLRTFRAGELEEIERAQWLRSVPSGQARHTE
jgi:hypothetical protein